MNHPDQATDRRRPATGGIYLANRGQVAYGHSIGVLMLECNIPFIPGDVGNATSFDFPVLYAAVPGATAERVIFNQDADGSLAASFVAVAKELAGQGVRAITGNCGFMSTFQRMIMEQVDVPVFMSSLMQVPMIMQMIPPDRKLAVLVADVGGVGRALLEPVGITGEIEKRCVFRGLEGTESFAGSALGESGELDADAIEREVVQVACDIVEEEQGVSAFLLECSDLPPYAAGIQRATGLPVFDWIGFIDYVQRAVAAREYAGRA